MNFLSPFLQFLNMGGYAFYVWTAYSIAFIVLIALIFVSRQHRQKTLKILKERLGVTDDPSSKKA